MTRRKPAELIVAWKKLLIIHNLIFTQHFVQIKYFFPILQKNKTFVEHQKNHVNKGRAFYSNDENSWTTKC